jgi:tryptophan-rich hypothetical protein
MTADRIPSLRLDPKKLLLSKWTAVAPRGKELHFLVTKVIEPDPPDTKIENIELEAVHSRRVLTLPWRELTDRSQWRQGWQPLAPPR